MGAGGHDQLAGTLLIHVMDFEQIINGLLGQIFTRNHTPACQFEGQALFHAFKAQQVVGGLSAVYLFFTCNGACEQYVTGAIAQLWILPWVCL